MQRFVGAAWVILFGMLAACSGNGKSGGGDAGPWGDGSSQGDGAVADAADAGAGDAAQGDAGGSGEGLHWAEIPEIVFVEGYAETEQMGIYQMDPTNRWTPGDLTRSSGWTSHFDTELELEDGDLTGITYDSQTGELSYDGSTLAGPLQQATVHLQTTDSASVSPTFRIRVLRPTLVWGPDAPTRYPGIGYDENYPFFVQGSQDDLQSKLSTDSTDASPNVFLILGDHTYEQDGGWYIGKPGKALYLLGEPGKRPVLKDGSIGPGNVNHLYFKNLELWNMTLGANPMDTSAEVTITLDGLLFRDQTEHLNSFGTPNYEGINPNHVWTPGSLTIYLCNSEYRDAGGVGLQHANYIEGRPNTSLYVNNLLLHGGRECSLLKANTRKNRIRNSYFSPVVDTENNIGNRASKLIDIPAATDTAVYNCSFRLQLNPDANPSSSQYMGGGTPTGAIFWRQRRSMWGADAPPPCDLGYPPSAQTSINGGGYPDPILNGWDPTVDTFASSDFWQAVAALPVTDPENPYTYKKFVSYCTFEWIDEGYVRRPVFRDDGTYPLGAYTTGGPFYLLAVPPEWQERSVTFFANNIFIGWRSEDVQSTDSWFDNVDYEHIEYSEVAGAPQGWIFPDRGAPRPYVFVGGDTGPHDEAAVGVDADGQPLGPPQFIELPAWFER